MTSENCLIERVAIALVEPAEGGNVGSCCRALVNCGFSGFSMVRPRVADWAEARKMAVHAASMLDAARTYDSLRAAVADAHWVVGVSGRPRSHPQGKQPIGLGDLTDRLRRLPAGGKAALVFGPERAGLTNAQLGLCQDILRLPTAEAYTSMNLAHAVLVVAWTMVLYSVSRFLMEIIRGDNPHDVAGLTVSQFISLVVFVAGLVYMWVLARKRGHSTFCS